MRSDMAKDDRYAHDYGIAGDRWQGMAKVMEEAGELIQVMAKIQGRGGHLDETPLMDKLIEEMGDLYAALSFFEAQNFTKRQSQAVDFRAIQKANKFADWAGLA
jgi:NTP pyrophosphatase (non-canonical NTP hydrolase)